MMTTTTDRRDTERTAGLSDAELLDELVDQRRARLAGELGEAGLPAVTGTIFDVVGELFDDEPGDGWRERAAARLVTLGLGVPGAPVAVRSLHAVA